MVSRDRDELGRSVERDGAVQTGYTADGREWDDRCAAGEPLGLDELGDVGVGIRGGRAECEEGDEVLHLAEAEVGRGGEACCCRLRN